MSYTTVRSHKRRFRGKFIRVKKHRRELPEARVPVTPFTEYRGREYFIDSGPYPAQLQGNIGNVRYFRNPQTGLYEVWFTKKDTTPYAKGNSLFFSFKTQKSARKLMDRLKI